MDILTGKIKEPKRNRRAVTAKSYVDPYKPVERLNRKIVDADSLLTAAELETKALLTQSLARF
jgi:hypothetical protein|tara:strand:+ start:103 stop:291 length:189 start_codon:yes stop_codon:yes gene_type:complete